MTVSADTFTPGAFWTPERARQAVERMQAVLASPEFSALFEGGPEGGGPPAGMLELAPKLPPPDLPSDAPISYRRARSDDIPRMAALLAPEGLPPLFIDEFLGGFVVATRGDVVVAAGGCEMYGDCAAIRSVVVDPRLRGTGAGRGIAECLLADARAYGTRVAYLFTQHAHAFWLHLGFEDCPVSAWEEPAHASWQWQYVSRFGGEMPDVYSMRMTL